MAHITVEEFIDFVSFNEINEETTALAAKVNGHIATCGECLEKSRAFQMVYDAIGRIDEAHIEKVFEQIQKKHLDI